MGDEDFIRKSLFMIGGLLIWALHFGLVYALNSLACTRGFAGMEVLGFGFVPVVVVATTALALCGAGAIFLLAYGRRGPARASRDDKPVNDFLRYSTLTITALAIVAIAWNGIPAFLVPPCS